MIVTSSLQVNTVESVLLPTTRKESEVKSCVIGYASAYNVHHNAEVTPALSFLVGATARSIAKPEIRYRTGPMELP